MQGDAVVLQVVDGDAEAVLRSFSYSSSSPCMAMNPDAFSFATEEETFLSIL
jgi:hypothetical protein